MKIDKELLKGSTAMLILNLLTRCDMYGYQMTKELENISDNVFTLKEGTLYPILHSMESQMLVESYLEVTESARKRKYYRITDKGRKYLFSKKEEWDYFSTAINKVIGGRANEQLCY